MNTHDHGHDHAKGIAKNKAVLITVLGLTASVMLVEFVGGWICGSLALISDAGHMLTDVGSLTLAIVALLFSRLPATPSKTYGFFRAEILSALFNGVFLIIIAAYIFYSAVIRFISPGPVEGSLMLMVASVGLVANLISAFVLTRGSKENVNVKAALWHVLSDALSSVGVIVGAIVILMTGFVLVDPIIGLVIGLVVLRGAWRVVSEAVDILLEATPRGIDFREVEMTLKRLPGVREAHDLHIWTITSGIISMSAHIQIDDTLVSECGKLSQEVKKLLHDKFDISHVTLEFECENCSSGNVCRIE